MRIDIITVLPKIFDSVFNYGVIGRAIKNGKIKLNIHDLHNYSLDKHKMVDDKPYGGGSGMVLKPEPIYRAIKKINVDKKAYVIYLSPQGKVLDQKKVFELYKKKWLIIICGRYEGIDERVMSYINEEISIGDYVLTGGEIPAMVLVDAVCRYTRGVVKEKSSLLKESFVGKFLDFPQYTRPYKFLNKTVPKVLFSGNHKEIEFYRLKESIKNTYKKRPELLKKIKLTKVEKQILEEIVS
ncbi:MAG: tRNA (guanosine(37)-N1)-methyltransferase TrmD [Endomicrobiia bacterium]